MLRNGVEQDLIENSLFSVGKTYHRIDSGGRVYGPQTRAVFFRTDAHGVARVDHGKAHGADQAVKAIQGFFETMIKSGQIPFDGWECLGIQRCSGLPPYQTIEAQVGRWEKACCVKDRQGFLDAPDNTTQAAHFFVNFRYR